MKISFLTAAVLLSAGVWAQEPVKWQGKFEQLDQVLPTPNEYRTGSGAPGPRYWQQQADYVISAELNDTNQSISGSETITYHNNSPSVLKYVWLQLDQNNLAKGNNTDKTSITMLKDSTDTKTIADDLKLNDFDGGFKIKSIKDANGNPLTYLVNYTMMRVDLPQPLKTGEKVSLNIEWNYNINNGLYGNERSQYEYFPEDGNYLYAIAQFFPRMCVYDDYEGWQNKQFLGQGEFALPFGNYSVKLTVPADHIVAATGVLQNASQVLSKTELERFEKARTTFDKPVFIVNQTEAIQREKSKSTEKKTWEFKADNVRDFAFASSRKFIWEAQAVKIGNKSPLAMAFYPREGNPLWEKEATLAVKNCLEVYSRLLFDYPYPVAISVHAAAQGMEYPMICFNRGRPDKSGKFSEAVRKDLIHVTVHEVGHNFFPMVVNTDERQTPWMDEGFDRFLQLLAQRERYPDINWTKGTPEAIAPFMKGDQSTMRPLMTNAEQVIKLGAEQYDKAAAGLYILRETVMGPELFDKALKEYAQRWAFKHPKPADFFRTMEDASAVDLDWFWRGWFYSTDNNNQSIDEVKWYRMRVDAKTVEGKTVTAKTGDLNSGSSEGKGFNDFSGGPQPFSVIPTDERFYGEFRSRVNDKSIVDKLQNKNIYEVKLSNKGGLVMPVIIEWTYKDGSKEIERIPAEIWRSNEKTVTKVFVKEKEVVNIVLDPLKETTDVSMDDNVFPRKNEPSKFDQFKKSK